MAPTRATRSVLLIALVTLHGACSLADARGASAGPAPSSSESAAEDAAADAAPPPATDGGIDADASPNLCDAGYAERDGGCQPLITCYRDADHDGYGDQATISQQPGSCSDGWTSSAVDFDCHDNNAAVHPDQSETFATGYMKGASLSFDYDCDGSETEGAPSKPKASATPGCVWTGSCDSIGGGYREAQPLRAGIGVNVYCGSKTTDIASCTAASAFHCRLTVNTVVRETNAAPVRCH
jgi:hypothetical protein